MGDVLFRPGVRAIPFGIAAVVLGFILKSPGTQADPADIGPNVSVFGTIHQEIYRFRPPIGSEHPVNRVRVASLDPNFGNIVIDEADMLADTPVSAALKDASFEERFAALEDRVASFDERFGSAARKRTGDVQLPQERTSSKPSGPRTSSPMCPFPSLPSGTSARDKQARIPARCDDGHTAVYDITARAVYLPNGRKLEAHSGLGGYMDSPRHVHLRMRGATPPNVYKLALREQLFHGVRAIRLTPVNETKMYGRAGILAHTYMLGPSGQSNGCVSFKNYPEFLNAYLRGEVTRLVVVEHLDNPPNSQVASGWLGNAIRNLFGGSDSGQYAAANAY